MIRQDKQLQLCMHTVICYYTVQSGSIQSKGTYTTHCHFTGLFPVKMLESKKKKKKILREDSQMNSVFLLSFYFTNISVSKS